MIDMLSRPCFFCSTRGHQINVLLVITRQWMIATAGTANAL